MATKSFQCLCLKIKADDPNSGPQDVYSESPSEGLDARVLVCGSGGLTRPTTENSSARPTEGPSHLGAPSSRQDDPPSYPCGGNYLRALPSPP